MLITPPGHAAAAVFGPQRGDAWKWLETLENGLRTIRVLYALTGCDVQIPGGERRRNGIAAIGLPEAEMKPGIVIVGAGGEAGGGGKEACR